MTVLRKSVFIRLIVSALFNMNPIEMQIVAFALGAVTCTPSAFFYFIVVMCIRFWNHTQDKNDGEKRNETSHEGLPDIRMMEIFRILYTQYFGQFSSSAIGDGSTVTKVLVLKG